jgi:hypothetical protein
MKKFIVTIGEKTDVFEAVSEKALYFNVLRGFSTKVKVTIKPYTNGE